MKFTSYTYKARNNAKGGILKLPIVALHLLISIVCCSDVFAQPGYQGHRNYISYVPSYSAFTGEYLINQNIEMGRSLSRKTDLALVIGAAQKMKPIDELGRGDFLVRVYHADIVVRHYIQEYIAPVGFFVQYGYGRVLSDVKKGGGIFSATSVNDDGVETQYYKQYRCDKIFFGCGLNKPLNSRVMMSWTTTLGFPIGDTIYPDHAVIARRSTIFNCSLGLGVIL